MAPEQVRANIEAEWLVLHPAYTVAREVVRQASRRPAYTQEGSGATKNEIIDAIQREHPGRWSRMTLAKYVQAMGRLGLLRTHGPSNHTRRYFPPHWKGDRRDD